MKSFMKIDGRKYDLEKVSVRFYFRPEPRVDVFCDTEELKKAGLAINSISLVETIKSVDDIIGKAIILEMDGEEEVNIADNKHNELGESVICRPGQVLELEGLFIKFNQIEGDYITLQMKASCFSLESLEMAIPVEASLCAYLKDQSK
jgi:hypothetical protein